MELTITNLSEPLSDYQLFSEVALNLLKQMFLAFTNSVYDTTSGSITLAGHSAILAFSLITLHTAAVYTYLTATMLTIQRRYHSKMDGYTPFQVFQTLITAMAATRGLTLWLRKNGATDDTHLLHIKRPRSLTEYLLPVVEVLPSSELSAEGPRT